MQPHYEKLKMSKMSHIETVPRDRLISLKPLFSYKFPQLKRPLEIPDDLNDKIIIIKKIDEEEVKFTLFKLT